MNPVADFVGVQNIILLHFPHHVITPTPPKSLGYFHFIQDTHVQVYFGFVSAVRLIQLMQFERTWYTFIRIMALTLLALHAANDVFGIYDRDVNTCWVS